MRSAVDGPIRVRSSRFGPASYSLTFVPGDGPSAGIADQRRGVSASAYDCPWNFRVIRHPLIGIQWSDVLGRSEMEIHENEIRATFLGHQVKVLVSYVRPEFPEGASTE